MDAVLVKTNGERETIAPKNGTDFTLEEIQKAVGGLINIIRLSEGWIMVINDEGKFMCEPNIAATLVALRFRAIFPNDYVAGDVIICKNEMVK